MIFIQDWIKILKRGYGASYHRLMIFLKENPSSSQIFKLKILRVADILGKFLKLLVFFKLRSDFGP